MKTLKVFLVMVLGCSFYYSVAYADEYIQSAIKNLADESIEKKHKETENKLNEQEIVRKCNETNISDSLYRLSDDTVARFVIFNFVKSTFTYYCDQLSIKELIQRMYSFVEIGSPAIDKLNNLVFNRVKVKKFHFQQVDIKEIKKVSDQLKYEVKVAVKGQDLDDPLQFFDVAKLKPIDVVLSVELEKVNFDNINSNIIEKSDIIGKDEVKKSINPFNLFVKDFSVISE